MSRRKTSYELYETLKPFVKLRGDCWGGWSREDLKRHKTETHVLRRWLPELPDPPGFLRIPTYEEFCLLYDLPILEGKEK